MLILVNSSYITLFVKLVQKKNAYRQSKKWHVKNVILFIITPASYLNKITEVM